MGLMQPPKTTDRRLTELEGYVAELLQVIMKDLAKQQEQDNKIASMMELVRSLSDEIVILKHQIKELKGDGK